MKHARAGHKLSQNLERPATSLSLYLLGVVVAAFLVATTARTAVSQQAYIKASNTDLFDQFGWSVAISGEFLVVGAWGEDSRGRSVNGAPYDNSGDINGAAYVYVRDGTSWSQQAYLKASNND